MPSQTGMVINRPNLFVRAVRQTTTGRNANFFPTAIVKSIHRGLNEEIDTAVLELPAASFGHHVQFGTRIQIFKDNTANKIFDGRVLTETSILSGDSDTITVTAYGDKWLLNTQTIIGTYDAKWNSDVFVDANQITGIKAAATEAQSGDNYWHNLAQKTIFNEDGLPDMQLVGRTSAREAGTPIFDKRGPHRDKKFREDASGNMYDNPYYPKFWTLGYIIKYLITFHNGKHDSPFDSRGDLNFYNIKILNADVVMLNELAAPMNFDCQGLPLVQAINKCVQQAGPNYAFDIEPVDEAGEEYYRIKIIQVDTAIQRDIKIATEAWIHNQDRLNVNSAEITRDARNVITSLKGLGNNIEVEMTINLVPAWDADAEVRAYFSDATDTIINAIAFMVFSQSSHGHRDDASNKGWSKTLGTATYRDVYQRCKDFFENRIFRVWKLPDDINYFRDALDSTIAYRGHVLNDLFVASAENPYRTIKPPESPLRFADFDGGVPDAKTGKYQTPIIFIWDDQAGVLRVVPFKLNYLYRQTIAGQTISTADNQNRIENGTPGDVGFINENLGLTFSVDKGTIVFSEPRYKKLPVSTKNSALEETNSTVKRDEIEGEPKASGNPSVAPTLVAAEVFMTAVISSDIRLSPLVQRTFEDFNEAGIVVNRYLENNEYRVVIRNHSILLNIIDFKKNSSGNYVATGFSKNRAGHIKRELGINSKPILRLQDSPLGRFEDFTDATEELREAIDTEGEPTYSQSVKAFVDDFDKFLDLINERADARSTYSEDISFTLDNFDISYSPGEKIRKIVNSRKGIFQSGYDALNIIISSVDIEVGNTFSVRLNGSSVQ